MAVKKKFTEALPVQLTPEWKSRIEVVADHPRLGGIGMAQVVRDCIETALPGFELELGIRTLEDLDDGELQILGLERQPEPAAPGREDRAKGSFGWTPPEG